MSRLPSKRLVTRAGKDKIAWHIFRIALIIAAIMFIYSQSHFVVVNKYVLSDNNMPKSFVGYKIAHVSDIRNSSNAFVNKIRVANPDVIVVTGGFEDNNGSFQRSFNILNQLSSIAPTYYVYNINDSGYTMNGSNAVDINNNTVILSPNVVDVDTFLHNVYGSEYEGMCKSDAEKAMEYRDYVQHALVESQNAHINLFGIFEPSIDDSVDAYELYKKDAYDLMLANKADYYICALGDIIAMNPICAAQPNAILTGGTLGSNSVIEGYAKGFYANNGVSIFVSNGIGTKQGITRFFNMPSVNIIELSDGTIENDSPLEKWLQSIWGDVGNIFENDHGFQTYRMNLQD